VDFLNLVHLVIAWKEGKEREHFEKYAAQSPVVHLVIVVAVSHEALGGPVPTRADVLSEGRLAVDAATRAEVGELDLVIFNKNVLRFDVPMENTILVHVVDCLDHLIHVVAHASLRQVVAAALDCLVHIHVHEFEDEGEAAGGLVVEDLVQRDDVGVGR